MAVQVEKMITLRHRLHACPEIGLDLPLTQAAVLEAIDGLGLEITLGKGSTSITAVLRGGSGPAGRERPTVLLRADMDGLPVVEETGLAWASDNGAMHACGHDTHTAMLVAALWELAAQREQLPGDVVFMFQTGEEGANGAQVMIDEGCLEAAGRLPDAAMGLHAFAHLPAGVFQLRPGALMAAGDSLLVTMHGKGGHGSTPERAKDPVPPLVESVLALQVGLTREFGAFEPVVLTVGSIHAGTKRNVIPASGSFEATIRTFDQAVRDRVRSFAPRVVQGVADSYGVRADIDVIEGYPMTINDDQETEQAIGLIKELHGPDSLIIPEQPIPGTEDFSRVLQRIPGYFAFLGACPPDIDPATAATNHSAEALFDDGALVRGAELEIAWARTRLAALAETR